MSPDGTKVAIGGDFFNVNGAYSHSIAVVRGAGEPSPGANLRTYPSGFIHNLSATKHIFSGDDGRFYISNEGTGGGVFDGRLAIDWTTLDQVWRDTCLGATQATHQYQGTLYSASHAHDCSAEAFQDGKRNYFMAQDASNATLLGWDPKTNDGIGERIGPRALTLSTGKTTGKKYLWGGGEFTTINGKPQRGLVRFGPDDVVRPPTPGPVVAEATSEGAVQVRWRTVVDPRTARSPTRSTATATPSPVWVGQSSSMWWKRPQVSFARHVRHCGHHLQLPRGRHRRDQPIGAVDCDDSHGSRCLGLVRLDRACRRPVPVLDRRQQRHLGARRRCQQHRHPPTQRPRRTRRVDQHPRTVAGDTSGSLTLDGVDDYVWNDEYAVAPTTWSVETWIRTTSTRGGKIIGYGSGRPRTDTGATQLSGSYDRHLYMEDSGRVALGAYNGSATVLRTPAALNDGQWHHVVGTQGNGGMQLFVDGRRVGTNSVSAPRPTRACGTSAATTSTGGPTARPATSSRARSTRPLSTPECSPPGGSPSTSAPVVAPSTSPPARSTPTAARSTTTTRRCTGACPRPPATTAQDSSYFAETPGTYGQATTRNVTGAVKGDGAVRTSGTTLGTVATQQPLSPTRVFSAEAWFTTSTTTGGKILGCDSSPPAAAQLRPPALHER